MTKRSTPPATALKLAFFPLTAGRSTRGILTPVTGPCRALLCILLGAAGPNTGRPAAARSPAERKMRRTGHWAPRQNVRHYGGRASGPQGLERTGRLLRTIRSRRFQSARLPTRYSEHRNERKRMDAGAPHDVSQQVPRQDDHESAALPAHPIRRLEAEIERTEGPEGAAPAETERLLEETWSLFTECLVIRDGLLEACDEIDRAMGGLQSKLGALPVGIEPHGHAAAPNGALATPNGANGTAAHGSGNGNGAYANGALVNGHTGRPSADGHGRSSTGG